MSEGADSMTSAETVGWKRYDADMKWYERIREDVREMKKEIDTRTA